MKKVPIIQLKTEIYHNKEINEAENILENIHSLAPETLSSISQEEKKQN